MFTTFVGEVFYAVSTVHSPMMSAFEPWFTRQLDQTTALSHQDPTRVDHQLRKDNGQCDSLG